jgi:hypothetical protein
MREKHRYDWLFALLVLACIKYYAPKVALTYATSLYLGAYSHLYVNRGLTLVKVEKIRRFNFYISCKSALRSNPSYSLWKYTSLLHKTFPTTTLFTVNFIKTIDKNRGTLAVGL